MTRLDRAVVFLVLIVVAALALGRRETVFDPAGGRRPQPPMAAPETPLPLDSATPLPRGVPASPGVVRPPLAPTSPQRVRRPPLEAPAADDPVFEIDTETVKSGTVLLGTAFSVDDRGVWLTARHVASDVCGQVALVSGGRPVAASIAYQDAESDLAVLRTRGGAPAMPLATDRPEVGETGYSFGFPTGVLGATRDSLLGRSRMQLGGRMTGTTPTLTWSEIRRFPDSLDTLGGMSGGPMLDESGRVVGILVAASVRRGRVHTVAPEVLSEAAQQTRLFDGAAPLPPVQEVADASLELSTVANELSGNSRIAKVYCRAR